MRPADGAPATGLPDLGSAPDVTRSTGFAERLSTRDSCSSPPPAVPPTPSLARDPPPRSIQSNEPPPCFRPAPLNRIPFRCIAPSAAPPPACLRTQSPLCTCYLNCRPSPLFTNFGSVSSSSSPPAFHHPLKSNEPAPATSRRKTPSLASHPANTHPAPTRLTFNQTNQSVCYLPTSDEL